ncbi:MAG: hypothetical protein HKN49_04125 [Gammaproteobacteria bacterium]|nr:hypothetical protein [Gammaproteobacteria bacterium]
MAAVEMQMGTVEMKVVELLIKRANDIAVVDCGHQRADIHGWSKLMNELDEMDCPALIDARSASSALSEIDAYLLALHIDDKKRLRRHRIAFVLPSDASIDLDFLIVSTRTRGITARCFDSMDEATTWVDTAQP